MKFTKGVTGVVIVVIALFGTIFAGYFLNVQQEPTTTTEYSSVTDVTSLFNFTEQPDYIEYNPAKNFTGYSLSSGTGSGINYTQSSTTNQYFMDSSSYTTTTMDITSMLSTPTVGTGYGYYDPYSIDGNYMYAFFNKGYKDVSKVLFTTVADSIMNNAPAGTKAYTVAFNNTDIYVENGGGSVYYSQLNIDGRDYGTLMRANTPFFSGPNGNWVSDPNAYYDISDITIRYDVVNDSYTMNYGGYTYSMSPTMRLAKQESSQIKIDLPLSNQHMVGTEIPNTLTGNNTIEVTYEFDTVYYYMNPAQGVSINNTSNVITTDWSNGKMVADAKIVFGNNNAQSSNTITTTNGDTIELNYDGTTNTISINSDSPVDIGSWEHFVLDINAINGKVSVSPVMTFNSYTDYQTANYTFDIGNISTTPFTKLKWSGTADSYTFSVSSTIVQQATKLLMTDPTLNIRDYFPLEDGYRLKIGSFATYGNTITINGITFYGDEDGNPIKDSSNMIYIPYTEKQYRLTNIYIINDELDGHTYLRMVNDNKTFDLGETVTDVVSMTGTWYFTTGLDQGTISQSWQYVWDWANSLTGLQSAVIFMGLIVVCGLVANKFWTIKIEDLAVIVGAIVILWCVTEVLS